MKINENIKNGLILSDLHFEWDLKTTDYSTVISKKYADAIFLCGDIADNTHALPFIEHLLSLGYKVFYILGNHEFYERSFHEVLNFWKEVKLNNFYFLNNDYVEFNNIKIIGSTLWTSVDTTKIGYDGTITRRPLDWFMRNQRKDWSDVVSINDFTLLDMIEEFWISYNFIQSELNSRSDKKIIVMTHHCPSFDCLDDEFKGRRTSNMYATELDWLFFNRKIDYWFHGHIHSSKDFYINNTNIICNARGYVEINAVNPNFNWIKCVSFED